MTVDYFTLHSQDYVLIVDYYSKYPEVISIQMKAAEAMIVAVKRYYICDSYSKVITNNMLFSSKKFKQFASDWNFEVIVFSLTYPTVKWTC